jgi:hypothetical protein
MRVLSFLTLGLDRVNNELHAPAVLLPRETSLLRIEYGVVRTSVLRRTLWKRGKSLVGNRTTIPRLSSTRDCQCTDCTVLY